MKKLKLFFPIAFALIFIFSCTEEDTSTPIFTENLDTEKRFDPDGNSDGGNSSGGSSSGCDISECTGNWLPNNYVTQWGFGSDASTCDICAYAIMPEGVSGELCVSLTNVDNLDDGLNVFVDDITFSGPVTSGQNICHNMDFNASFYATIYLITDEGCTSNHLGYTRSECDNCCEDENAQINFTELGTDINYQTLCGKINVSLDTDCPGPFTWEYSAEPGTGLKGEGSGDGTYFDIYSQNDCGLLGPGHYTVTFTDGLCATFTESYYFEPCNTELFDPANPAVLQLDNLKVRCTASGVRFTSQTLAKCCDCTGSEISMRITNDNGDVTLIEGGFTTEAGCNPADSYFKRVIDYNPDTWTEWDNTIEIIDCEGNVVYTKLVDNPCD